MLIVPAKSKLHGRRKFTWRDLEHEPLVLFEAGSAVRALIDSRLETEGIRPEIVMELRSIEAIKQMVAEGIGAGFVSRYALAQPEDGLQAAKGPIRRQLSVVWRTDRTLGSATRAFLDLLD
jgi:DNA-binding transcriptional LysR family regulator